MELANIQAIWETVAEDYAPFNINVTTVEPSVLAPGVPIANANKVAMRVAIGAQVGDWCVSGGISPVNSFTNSLANVVYVFATVDRDPPVGVGNVCVSRSRTFLRAVSPETTGYSSCIIDVAAAWQYHDP